MPVSSVTVQLLGASDNEVQILAERLTDSLLRSHWPAVVHTRHQGIEPSARDLILLTGLVQPTDAAAQADTLIRATLSCAGLSFGVLYGSLEERLAQAHLLIHARLADNGLGEPLPNLAESEVNTEETSRWVWQCEKCGDSQYEYRSLRALLASRLTEPMPGAVADGRGV